MTHTCSTILRFPRLGRILAFASDASDSEDMCYQASVLDIEKHPDSNRPRVVLMAIHEQRRIKKCGSYSEKVMITHSLPVTLQTGFSQHCRTFEQPYFNTCRCTHVYKMNQGMQLYHKTSEKGQREKEEKSGMINLTYCGSGAEPHRTKIKLGVLPNGYYNY